MVEIDEAYNNTLFVGYYDRMVSNIPPEMEVGKDVEFICQIIQKLNKQSSLTLLDLAAGSGRMAFGVAQSLQQLNIQMQLTCILVDSSEKMIELAKHQQPQLANVTFQYIIGDMSQWPEALSQYQSSVDVAVVGAGSIHHLLSNQQRRAMFNGVKSILKQDGYFLLCLLKKAHILPDDDSEKKIDDKTEGESSKQEYGRKTLSTSIIMDEDGDNEEVVRTDFEVFYPDGRASQTFWQLRVFSSESAIKMLQNSDFCMKGGWKTFVNALNLWELGDVNVEQDSTVLLAGLK
eukprot:TRINITY_DN34982_c0_g1_i1.p1 TRINITY_DN34982_c0_g1~~TRINITY_DN34982_c0_g1_i1.p1  ORF type:complete len:290 (+),score=43.41 TRINITY_DN34982_c0_g1_i1:203-1072(+)